MVINLKDTNILTDNSNECLRDSYFLLTSSNKNYLELAKDRGAVVVDIPKAKELLNIDKNIKIIGITGTNGKTTTAWAIHFTLCNLGFNSALAGTEGFFINKKQLVKKHLTTGNVIQNLNFLKLASESGCQFLVMEVSSHSIVQSRIEGLEFALKIFTNLTQDHLDYHKSFEEYVRVKSSFFVDDCPKLINADDNSIKFNPKNAFTYSIKQNSTFKVVAYGANNGIDAIVKTRDEDIFIESDLIGEFNLYNLLAAFCAVKFLTGINSKKISKSLSKFKGVKGRLEIVSSNPMVIVDFAHTPDGICKVLQALNGYNLITVFGAGGDRDRTKRKFMGQIAQRLSKYCVVTNDNPRFENPDNIVKDILEGMAGDNFSVIQDRAEAIEFAINLVRDSNDLVIILGKGDEDYQEICGVKHHFSDKEYVLNILKGFKNDN